MSIDTTAPVHTDNPPPRRRRRGLLIAVAALVVVGLGLGLGLGLTGGKSGPSEVKPATTSGSHSPKSAVAGRGPNVLVFQHVPADRASALEGQLARAHGVRGVTYYPKTQELDVFMSKQATEGQKAVVRRAVTGSG